MREAEEAAGGNQDKMLHNVTASLGISCALLCAFSAYGVATHRVTIMSQVGNDVVMAFFEVELFNRFAFLARAVVNGEKWIRHVRLPAWWKASATTPNLHEPNG